MYIHMCMNVNYDAVKHKEMMLFEKGMTTLAAPKAIDRRKSRVV